jgi:hypothetical protein
VPQVRRLNLGLGVELSFHGVCHRTFATQTIVYLLSPPLPRCAIPHTDGLTLELEADHVVRESHMKKTLLLAAVLLSGAILAQAGNKPQTGTIISENSVACGSRVEKKQTVDVLCQEYVVRTAGTDYHIRQLKAADRALISVNTPIEFTVDKDKMKFKANGKSYEYLIVSEAAVAADAAKP